MSKLRRIDPFASSDAELKVDAATSRLLKQRIKSASEAVGIRQSRSPAHP